MVPGNDILISALIYLLVATLCAKLHSRLGRRPKRRQPKYLSPRAAAFACVFGPIPLILQNPDKKPRSFPNRLLAVACVVIALFDSAFVQADLREDVAQILHDNEVVLARNVIFERKSQAFPRRLDIITSATLSYGALERAPTFLERAAYEVGDALSILKQKNSSRTNLAEPAILPKFKIPYHYENGIDNRVSIHKAQDYCNALGMTLAAPRNTTELRKLQAWALQNGGWSAPGERIWIDATYSLHEQSHLNPLTKDRLDISYPGVESKFEGEKWLSRIDDYWSHPALVLQSGELDFLSVKDMQYILNGQNRYYSKDALAPTAHVVCQSFGMKRDDVLVSGELTSARDLYAAQNTRLPLEALQETENFLSALALEERRRIRSLIETYGLKRLPQTVVPPLISQSIVPIDFSVSPPEAPSNETKPFYKAPVLPPLTRKNRTRSKRDDTSDWTAMDSTERVLLSVAKAVPVFGIAADAVDQILRHRRLHSFQQTTAKRVRNLERKIAKSARRLEEVSFASEVLDSRVQQLEFSVNEMRARLSPLIMSLEINQRLDLIVAEAETLHAEFLVEIAKFDQWLSALQRGKSPDQLFSGKLLASVRELIRDLGLSTRSELQSSASTLVQDPIRIDALQIISNVRVSDVPWTLYFILVLPVWQNGKLVREEIDYKYIAIDRDHQNYVPLSDQEFQDCRDAACILPNPIRPLRSAKCGPIALVGGSLDPSCKVVELPANDFYASFGSAIAYSVKTSDYINLVCPFSDSTPRRVRISGTGVCLIPRGCHATNSEGAVFYGLPSSGIPNDDTPMTCMDTSNLDMKPIHDSHLEYWTMIKIGSYFSNLTPIYVGIGILSFLILLCLLGCIYCRWRRNNRQHYEPRYRVGLHHDQLQPQVDPSPPRAPLSEFCPGCLGPCLSRNDRENEYEDVNDPPVRDPPPPPSPRPRREIASSPIDIPPPQRRRSQNDTSLEVHGGNTFQSAREDLDHIASSPVDVHDSPPEVPDRSTGNNKGKSGSSTSTPNVPPLTIDAERSAETARNWRHFGAVPPAVTQPDKIKVPGKPPRDRT